jgi:hypothetical protein
VDAYSNFPEQQSALESLLTVVPLTAELFGISNNAANDRKVQDDISPFSIGRDGTNLIQFAVRSFLRAIVTANTRIVISPGTMLCGVTRQRCISHILDFLLGDRDLKKKSVQPFGMMEITPTTCQIGYKRRQQNPSNDLFSLLTQIWRI